MRRHLETCTLRIARDMRPFIYGAWSISTICTAFSTPLGTSGRDDLRAALFDVQWMIRENWIIKLGLKRP